MPVTRRNVKIHRYRVTETWGDAPDSITEMVGDPEAWIVDTYRGSWTQWEVERGGEIIYGFAGTYAGVSRAAEAKIEAGA